MATVGSIESNVRLMLRDTKEGRYEVEPDLLRLTIVRRAQHFAARGGAYELWTTASVTAGNEEVVINNANDQQLLAVRRVRLVSNGELLRPRTPEWVEEMQSGSSPQSGTPTDYYLMEHPPAGETKLILYPTPDTGDTVQVFVAYALLADTFFATQFLDPATEVSLHHLLISALEHEVAVTVASGLDQQSLARLRLNPGVVNAWTLEAERLKAQADARKATLSRIARIPAQVP